MQCNVCMYVRLCKCIYIYMPICTIWTNLYLLFVGCTLCGGPCRMRGFEACPMLPQNRQLRGLRGCRINGCCWDPRNQFLVVWNICYFPIYWEYSSQLTNIFQRGSNHQPESIFSRESMENPWVRVCCVCFLGFFLGSDESRRPRNHPCVCHMSKGNYGKLMNLLSAILRNLY